MDERIHPLSNNPTAAWDELSKKQKFVRIRAKNPTKPVTTDKLRVVCMSDTHTFTSHLRFDIPDGDVFVHAGDFTFCGSPEEVNDFNSWLGRLPHKHKLVIAGNHELSFDSNFTHPLCPRSQKLDDFPTLGFSTQRIREAMSCVNITDSLTNATYLQDSGVQISGINFYGTPWQPEYHKWAFNLPRGAACLQKWDLIPDNTDILITHTPPLGHGDLCCSGVRAGCVELLSVVQKRVQPKYHVFGHIHEAYGITSDGKIIFVNASTCNKSFAPMNEPIVFDVPIPAGCIK